jgi:DNA-binding MurR/RpiR family transcriptional regulator
MNAERQYASLSPQEQRVADFIFDHFDDLISYNSAELAQLSGVSKATVSRLFKRLGYEKYKDMRDELRTLRQSGMPLTDNRDAVQGNTLLARHYKQEMANLTQWVNALDAQQFAEAISGMVKPGALRSACATPIRRRCTCASSCCRRAGRCWCCRSRGRA